MASGGFAITFVCHRLRPGLPYIIESRIQRSNENRQKWQKNAEAKADWGAWSWIPSQSCNRTNHLLLAAPGPADSSQPSLKSLASPASPLCIIAPQSTWNIMKYDALLDMLYITRKNTLRIHCKLWENKTLHMPSPHMSTQNNWTQQQIKQMLQWPGFTGSSNEVVR